MVAGIHDVCELTIVLVGTRLYNLTINEYEFFWYEQTLTDGLVVWRRSVFVIFIVFFKFDAKSTVAINPLAADVYALASKVEHWVPRLNEEVHQKKCWTKNGARYKTNKCFFIHLNMLICHRDREFVIFAAARYLSVVSRAAGEHVREHLIIFIGGGWSHIFLSWSSTL